jgi:hypothetical protein
VNFYLEPLPQAGKNRAALYPSPGFQSFLSVTQVGTRGLYELNGRAFAVIGNGLYELFSNQTATFRGSVAQDSNPAQMVGNGAVGAQILIASGSNGYCFNLNANVLTQVLTGDCVQVAMLDGYGIALNPATSKFRLSNLNDFITWDPTQFAQRGDAPDNWAALLVNIPDIWLIGQKTGVVYYDAGTFPFPFAPRPGATFKYGIVAPFSLSTAGGQVLWLSRNAEGAGIVVMAVGYTPQRVSTFEVESAISEYARTSSITDAEALMFQYRGHLFYVLTFPSANATWVFDLQTGVWIEWGKWNSPMTRYDIWQPRVHAYAFGQHLVGDRNTGIIAAMDVNYGTELDGSVIRRMRIAPSLFNENREIPISRLELFLEAGVGTVSGAGSDPVATMQTSDDGGKTYLPERSASAGKTADFKRRVFWTRMGIPRDRVNKFVMSDPIPWRIIDAFINNIDPPGAR